MGDHALVAGCLAEVQKHTHTHTRPRIHEHTHMLPFSVHSGVYYVYTYKCTIFLKKKVEFAACCCFIIG